MKSRFTILTSEEAFTHLQTCRNDLALKCKLNPKDMVEIKQYEDKKLKKTVFHFSIRANLQNMLAGIFVAAQQIPLLSIKPDPIRAILKMETLTFIFEIRFLEGNRGPKFAAICKTEYNLETVDLIYAFYAFCNGYMTTQTFVKEENQNSLLGKFDEEKPLPKTKEDAIKELREMGLTVFDKPGEYDWSDFAGYENQKKELFKIFHGRFEKPHIYAEILNSTRRNPRPSTPKGVLLSGPPGVGKTHCAKIVASTMNLTFIVFKKSLVGSFLVNKGNKKITRIFQLCNIIGESVLFIDEIDQIGKARGNSSNIHNDDLLNTLIQEMEGIDSKNTTMVMGATNFKDALDGALLQRFTTHIRFEIPTLEERTELFDIFAKQLSKEERSHLAALTEGFAGRIIEQVCENVESTLLEAIPKDYDITNGISPPNLEDYKVGIEYRKKSAGTVVKHTGFMAEDETIIH